MLFNLTHSAEDLQKMTNPHESEIKQAQNEQARIRWADDEAEALKNADKNKEPNGGFVRAINWLYKTTPGRIVAGSVAAAAVVTAIAAGPRGADTGPESQPTVTEPSAEPDSTEQPPVENPETNGPSISETGSYQIEAGQSPEALAQNIAEELSDWHMAGAGEFNTLWIAEVTKTADASDAAFNAFLDAFVAKQTAIRATAIFGPDYATNPDVQDYVNGQIAILKRNLTLNQATVASGTPYVQSMRLDASRAPSANQQELDITTVDNAVESGADKMITNTTTGGNTFGGEKSTIKTETQEVDGKVIIVKISGTLIQF